MNARCLDILKYIISHSPVRPKALSEKFAVTYRTILADLNTIDEFLHDHFFQPLKRSKRAGVSLQASREEIERMSEILKALQPYDYLMSQEQRKIRIVMQLFKEEKPITLETLADKLFVSRSTIVKDLESVEAWLAEKQLSLVKKTNYGVYIDGEEQFKRKAVMELLLLDANKDNIAKLVKDYSITLSELNPEIASMMEELFDVKKVEFLKIAVQKMEEDLDAKFTDLSFSTLVIHIGITIDRIKAGKISKPLIQDTSHLTQLAEYAVVETMCRRIGEHFGFAFPQEEIINMMLYILCTSIQKNAKIEHPNKANQPLEVLCNDLIFQVEMSLGFKFTNYDALLNDLLLHMIPTVNRIKYDMQLTDNFTADIKVKYSNLFECVKEACSTINNFTSKTINDDEIAYITLHFCAAVERQFNFHHNKLRVITVCSSGIGTARILESRLRSQFPNLDIVDTLSFQEYLQRNLMDIDLIVSTIYLETPVKPYIHVNPLLTEEDCNKINRYLELEGTRTSENRNIYASLMDIIHKHCIIKNEAQLTQDIQSLFQLNPDGNSRLAEPADPQYEYELHELLTADTIRLQAGFNHWEQAVVEGANLLLQKNYILPRYVDALLASCKRTGPLGPYCVISPGIAMPHAKPIDGVITTCMCLVTFNRPIAFHHRKFDPVRLMIIFGSSDGKNHLKALKQLTQLLMDQEKLQLLTHSYYKDEVVEMIRDFSSHFILSE